MGFFSKLFDDVLGLDPGGGGIYKVARGVLGDKVADDILGMDPTGKGAIKAYNAAIPLAAGYYGAGALGGLDAFSGAPQLLGEAGGYGAGAGAGGGAGGGFLSDLGASASSGGNYLSNLFSGSPQLLGEAGGYGAGAGAGAGLFGAGASNYLMPAALVGNALIGAGAAKSAASTQAAAQQQANQLLAQQYQQQRADLQPYSAAGVNALSKFQGMADYTPFGTSQFQADPGYAFRLSEGQKALERSAAARGGLLSGGTGKRIAAYGQEAASQEYQNAFNRYQTERAAKLAPYQSLINVGQASAAGQANAAGNYGVQAGQGLTNIGGAQAAGTVAGANALGSGLGQYLNYTSNENLANALNTRKTGYA